MIQVEVYRDPVFHLVFKDFFSKKVNENILEEAVSNQKSFSTALTGKGIDSVFRSNKTAYYDDIYKDRSKSVLLTNLDDKFGNDREFRELLSTSPVPVGDFMLTTSHETQVSRYGGEKDHYLWHQDRFADIKRHLTVVYYFFKEPKRWKGGFLSFTDSPAFEAHLFDKDAKIKTLEPENNMAVVFGATSLHKVEATEAPDDFESGRFSVNCWVGFN